MKKKIILIGKSSFISNNLFYHLKNKFSFKVFSLSEFLILSNNKIKDFDWIINCSIDNNYIKKSYKEENDLDLKIVKKILPLRTKYIFLSSRKIYKSSNNINEQSEISPKCNYSRNKFITEKKLLSLLKDRLLILRISNLIGLRQSKLKKKNVHKIFIDHFFDNIKKGFIYRNNKQYKDFLSTEQFSKILEKLINKNVIGVYNVSMGKKVYLKNLIRWLNYYNSEKYMYLNFPSSHKVDCFTLNNNKIKKKINFSPNLIDLEKYCKKISKIFFEK